MTDRDYECCRVCGNLLGQLSDSIAECRKCGTSYEEMPEREEKEVF